MRLREFFNQTSIISVAEAPGRLDVMGGIADYSGSLVLEGTIGRRARACVAQRIEPVMRLMTLNIDDASIDPDVVIPLESFYSNGQLNDYPSVKDFFQANPRTHWAAYVAGCMYALLAEGKCERPEHGMTIVIDSNVPLGAGVSSSAAIEVATMTALTDVLRIVLDGGDTPPYGLELAALCQVVENKVVGAPCGIMDQVTCALGEAGRLLALRCQPHDLLGTYPAPEGAQVLGINSNVRHAVSGQRYTHARVGAFMGLRILQDHVKDNRWAGYLCNIDPPTYESEFKRLLPESIKGREFLERFGSTPDPVTTVHPDATYRVRACAEHPIYENENVQRFLNHLQSAKGPNREGELKAAGELMYASHRSYGERCDLGCEEADLLVELAKRSGPAKGIYGAKITGGGGGGTVAVLREEGVDDVIENIVSEYHRQTGLQPEVFTGTLPGALHRGVVRKTVEAIP